VASEADREERDVNADIFPGSRATHTGPGCPAGLDYRTIQQCRQEFSANPQRVISIAIRGNGNQGFSGCSALPGNRPEGSLHVMGTKAGGTATADIR